jgi:hypothetical protein
MSKLGADGLPIYDERGKVLKGPGYWKPEPTISLMLQNEINRAAVPMNEEARGLLDKQNTMVKGDTNV